MPLVKYLTLLKTCTTISNLVSHITEKLQPFPHAKNGVRQGEKLSLLLFSIFLNDLESPLSDQYRFGLNFSR